jgi:hypothetical protein
MNDAKLKDRYKIMERRERAGRRLQAAPGFYEFHSPKRGPGSLPQQGSDMPHSQYTTQIPRF